MDIFELRIPILIKTKSRTNKAAVLMTISALCFSIIAPISTLLSYTNFDFVIFVCIAWIISTLFFLIASPKRLKIHRLMIRDKEIISLSILRAGAMLAGYALFLFSLDEIGGAIPTIILESHPIAVIFLSPFFLGRFFIKKVELYDYVILILSCVGISLMILSKADVSASVLGKGLFYALLSAAFVATAIISGTRVTFLIRSKFKLNEYDATAIGYSYRNIFGLLAVVSYLVYDIETLITQNFNIYIFIYLFVFSYVVIFLSETLDQLAYQFSDSPSIASIYYLTPVFALVWLYIVDSKIVTPEVAIGAGLIVTANALRNFSFRQSPSMIISIFSIQTIGALIYLISPNSNAPYFYDLITILLIFFTLLVVYILERLVQADRRETDYYIKLHGVIMRLGDTSHLRHLRMMREAKTETAIYKPYSRLMRSIDREVSENLIDKFYISRKNRVRFSEWYLMLLLNITIFILCIFYRPLGSYSDIVSLTICISSMFLIGQVYEAHLNRSRSIKTRVYNGRYLGLRLEGTKSQARVVSAVCLLLLYGIYIWAFIDKA